MRSRPSPESNAARPAPRYPRGARIAVAESTAARFVARLNAVSNDSPVVPRRRERPGLRSTPVDARIAALAARQRGVVHRDQLLTMGLHRSSLARRVKAGRLHPVLPRVLAVGHVALPVGGREAAALLWRGPRSVLSHESAAWALGLVPVPEHVHVSSAVGGTASRSGVVVHRVTTLAASDVQVRDGLRITGPARTMLDLAATIAPSDLERLVAEARVRRLVGERELRDAVARHPNRSGGPALLALLDAEHEPALTRSEAERSLRDLVRRAGMPLPRANVRAAGYEVDALWLDERVVVEVDGFAFHGSRRAFERDRRKAAALEASGFHVLRVSWRQLVDAPETVIAQLATALARAR